MCLSVCPACVLTFESLDLETSFLVCRYTFIITRSTSYIKVIRSRSRSHQQTAGYKNVTKYSHLWVVHFWLKGNLVIISITIIIIIIIHWRQKQQSLSAKPISKSRLCANTLFLDLITVFTIYIVKKQKATSGTKCASDQLHWVKNSHNCNLDVLWTIVIENKHTYVITSASQMNTHWPFSTVWPNFWQNHLKPEIEHRRRNSQDCQQ